MKDEMNIKKHWLKSLAVAAVVAMGSANASAEVLSALTADGDYSWSEGGLYIPGTMTPSFKHAGGPLLATYSAECAVKDLPAPPGGPKASVNVVIEVRRAEDNKFITDMPPARISQAFCSSDEKATNSVTGVANLPPGMYRIRVFGAIKNVSKADAVMGGRSLVVFR